ncbi:MAG: glycoside hydrolase family 16 protein [Clostridia bacterium]|nr:glycoside hydrolase family 16 protein [Clostridia bacterium]
MFEWLYKTVGLAYREAWAIVQIFEHTKEIWSSFSIKGFFAGIMAIFELFGMLLFGHPITPSGQELNLDEYKLVLYDEFEGDSLNTNLWFHRGEGSQGQGKYSSEQVSFKDGNMIITGEYRENGKFGEGWYGAEVGTVNKYKHGYFEIRCICNKDPYFWSAFWIQADHPYDAEYSKGGVGGAEIDIFESMSHNSTYSNSVTSTVHCAGVDGIQEGIQSANLGTFKANNIYEEYNTYGLEWTEDEYIFYINGVETVRTDFGNGVSQVAEMPIISLVVPSSDKFDLMDKETYNTQFKIDYVKIYQKEG